MHVLITSKNQRRSKFAVEVKTSRDQSTEEFNIKVNQWLENSSMNEKKKKNLSLVGKAFVLD